ncbi:M28 family peptidase [Pontibacter sp. 172403-2]|uniref:M28 family metallopeptidase n=1 Tax=Pontibacter rufus TaxID=2791028 RepID=UPI0018AF88E7|nr:M28 family peptidase [Pontibacter sp. 172403-2]MBF9252088.1 M28 family peptidase [Pontibacter sp. 172403-2]
MKRTYTLLLFAALLATACNTQAPVTSAPETTNNAPAFSAIKEDELRADLFYLASDDMRGRRAGSADELRAAAWIAGQARQAGLKPAGEDSTYFQFFPIRRVQVSDNSQLKVNDKPLTLWKDTWIATPVQARINAPIIWLNSLADTAKYNLKGKVIAMPLQAPDPLPVPGISLRGYRYTLSALRQQSNVLRNQQAAAIVLVADEMAEASLAFAGHGFEEGQYILEDAAATQSPKSNTPLILVKQNSVAGLKQAKASLTADINVNSYVYPSVNVVAMAPGTDPELKQEYVLFSGHHDHDGIGTPIAGDSIWNGADDNASVSVALLAIGRAWVQNPGKRSALFVWHGAEERGLLGSRWFVEHPTVDKEAIVAVLNADMIGRNAPDSAALLGATLPHRNSAALVDMAMQANDQYTNFIVDTSWDDPKHPEGWYFRSDHLPYARAGIPAIFFTTLLHPDYHTPKDEAEGINIEKLARMTRWMYATGWTISQTPQRPAVDPGFKLER